MLTEQFVIPTLADAQQAYERIKPFIRQTPLLRAHPVKAPITDSPLFLKLECMQITGSFKARGATSKLTSLPQESLSKGIVTASGGNHGLGVAYAGWIAHVPATIYLGENTPPIKAEMLRKWGATAITEGAVWDDANRAALRRAEQDGLTYFHPFADAAVIAGQATVAIEVLAENPAIDVLVVAIGGGGLISGVSIAAKAINPKIRIIGVEPTGAPTLKASLDAGHVVELAEIRSVANTLSPRMSAEINYQIIKQNVEDIVLVTDQEMHDAARWLWLEMGVAAELSGAAALAALHSGKLKTAPHENVCVLVCGAGNEGMQE